MNTQFEKNTTVITVIKKRRVSLSERRLTESREQDGRIRQKVCRDAKIHSIPGSDDRETTKLQSQRQSGNSIAKNAKSARDSVRQQAKVCWMGIRTRLYITIIYYDYILKKKIYIYIYII